MWITETSEQHWMMWKHNFSASSRVLHKRQSLHTGWESKWLILTEAGSRLQAGYHIQARDLYVTFYSNANLISWEWKCDCRVSTKWILFCSWDFVLTICSLDKKQVTNPVNSLNVYELYECSQNLRNHFQHQVNLHGNALTTATYGTCRVPQLP